MTHGKPAILHWLVESCRNHWFLQKTLRSERSYSTYYYYYCCCYYYYDYYYYCCCYYYYYYY